MNMKDGYGIDGHKLDLHIDKVWAWQSGRDITPIYIEVSPTARCNHNCTFCALDYTNHINQTIPTPTLIRLGTEFAKADVRGVMFGGEGEPTLHPDLPQVILNYSKMGVHTALTTNGTGLSPEFAIEGGRELAWVKVSINGGTEQAYAEVHGHPGLEKCFYNIAQFKKSCGTFIPTLGAQAVALPSNISSLPSLCQRAIDAGLDYVVIKPYSYNLYSHNNLENIEESEWIKLEYVCQQVCRSKIKLVIRHHAYSAILDSTVPYARCLSVPHFWAYVRSNSDLVACSNHMQDERFVLGNLESESFQSIWFGHRSSKRTQLMATMRCFDVSQCRKACRMNSVNEWLWRISQPNPHRSFI